MVFISALAVREIFLLFLPVRRCQKVENHWSIQSNTNGCRKQTKKQPTNLSVLLVNHEVQATQYSKVRKNGTETTNKLSRFIKNNENFRNKVLMAVEMSMLVFWVVILCELVDID
jgi:hypothetical protein